MEIISINNAKHAKNRSEVFLEIILDVKNLMKIPVQIFYHKEEGYKNFLLTYNINNFKVAYSTFLPKILPHIIKTVIAHDLKIGFKGFPKEVFQRSILKPGLRWKFEDKFILFGDGKIDPNYVEIFGENELKKLETNEDFYPFYLKKFEAFETEDLKQIAFKILEDFKNDSSYLRKKLILVDSYPKTNEEASQERFIYYIYNQKNDFEKTYSLLEKYFNKEKLISLKKYLKIAEQIGISFAIMAQNKKLRTSIYFTTHDLKENEINELFNLLNIKLETHKLWGIGIDSQGNTFNYKLYYEEPSINTTEIKEHFNDIPLENKRKLLRFLNSRTKALKSVLLDKKIKNGKIYSKRIDVSLQYNSVKIHQLMSLFDLDLRGLTDKDLFTLSFELTPNEKEKINIYYALKIPIPEEEKESYKKYQY